MALGSAGGIAAWRVQRAEPLASEEVVARDPSISHVSVSRASSATSHSSYETEPAEKGALLLRVARRVCSLTSWMTGTFLLILVIPLIAMLPVLLVVMAPVLQHSWEEVHTNHQIVFETYLNEAAGYVHRVAGTYAAVQGSAILDPEGGMQRELCRMIDTHERGVVGSVAVFIPSAGKYASCAELPPGDVRDGLLVGGVSKDGHMQAVHYVNSTTFEMLPTVAYSIPEGVTDVRKTVSTFYRNNEALAWFAEAFTKGGGRFSPGVPPELCWTYAGRSARYFYFTYPFGVYTTAAALAEGRYDNWAVVELRVSISEVAREVHIDGSRKGSRLALLRYADTSAGSLVFLSNNWNQPVPAAQEDACWWWWCNATTYGVPVEQVEDPYVRVAVDKLDLTTTGGAAVGATDANSTFSRSVTFMSNGALVVSTAWHYGTPTGVSMLLLAVSPQFPVTGAYWRSITIALCVGYGVPVVLFTVFFFLFVEFCLSRPLREVNAALVSGMDFGDMRRLDTDAQRAARRRKLNPLRVRADSGDGVSGALQRRNDDGDYMTDAGALRQDVRVRWQLVRLVEIDELFREHNASMERLRVADTFATHTSSFMEQARSLSEVSSSQGPSSSETSITTSGGKTSTPPVTTTVTTTTVYPSVSTTTTITSLAPSSGTAGTLSSLEERGEVSGDGDSGSLVRSTASGGQSHLQSSESQPSHRKGELSCVEMRTTLVYIAPRDQNLLHGSRINLKREHYRTAFHSRRHGHFPTASGADHYFTQISRLADRFGGIVHTMTPELTIVVFNAAVLNYRTALMNFPETFAGDGEKYEKECEAATTDATVAMRFTLAFSRFAERESRLIPPTQLIADTIPCKVCRYLQPRTGQNLFFFHCRNMYWDVARIALQLRVPITVTEETALLVWRHVRCIPVEALRVPPRPAVRSTSTAGCAVGGSSHGAMPPSDDGPRHLILYEALRGAANTPAWVRYRDSFNAAFMPMLRGDYPTALASLQSISGIAGLEAPLLPKTASVDQEALVAVGGPSRRQRNRKASKVTWVGVPFSVRESSVGGTHQLDRLIAICERNVAGNITLPFVHTVTVCGFIRRSEDLQDTPKGGGSSRLSHSGPGHSGGPMTRSQHRLARAWRRLDRKAALALLAGPQVPGRDGADEYMALTPSLNTEAVLASLPQSVIDTNGVEWDLAIGIHGEDGSDVEKDGQRVRRRRLMAFNPITGAVAAAEVRGLLHLPAGSSAADTDGGTAATSSTGHSRNSLPTSRQSRPHEEDGSAATVRRELHLPDAVAAMCPQLLKYHGFLDCRPACNVLLLVSEPFGACDLGSYVRCFGRPVPLRFTARVCEEVLRGLVFLHRQGRVHGDLSPENILVEPSACMAALARDAAAPPPTLTSPLLPPALTTSFVRLKKYLLAGMDELATLPCLFAPPVVSLSRKDALMRNTAAGDVFSFGLVLALLVRQYVVWEWTAPEKVRVARRGGDHTSHSHNNNNSSSNNNNNGSSSNPNAHSSSHGETELDAEASDRVRARMLTRMVRVGGPKFVVALRSGVIRMARTAPGTADETTTTTTTTVPAEAGEAEKKSVEQKNGADKEGDAEKEEGEGEPLSSPPQLNVAACGDSEESRYLATVLAEMAHRCLTATPKRRLSARQLLEEIRAKTPSTPFPS